MTAQAAACATNFTFDELMQALRAPAERHADFEEARQMAVLTQPLVRRGTLDYTFPDKLSMQVESPYFERITIVGDALSIERRSGVTQVALATQPALAAWVESMRATLAGDGAALRAHFNITLEGSLANWRLALVPRDAPLRTIVAAVNVSGHDGVPTRFEIDEVRGDSTVVDIKPRKP